MGENRGDAYVEKSMSGAIVVFPVRSKWVPCVI